MKCGAPTETKEATKEVQSICENVKNELEKKCERDFMVFNAILYKTQVVAGTNYFVKIKVSEDEDGYIHARIFKSLPHAGGKCELGSVLNKQKLGDSLDYF